MAIQRVDRLMLLAIVVDVLLLPVLPRVFLPASTAICLWVVLTRWTTKKLRLNLRARLFILLILLSGLASFALKPAFVNLHNATLSARIAVHEEDLKRLLYLLIAIMFYVCVRYLAEQDARFAHWVGKVGTTGVLLAAVVLYVRFTFSYPDYVGFRDVMLGTNVNLSSVDELQRAGYLQRFGFILLDPNNAAYFMIMMSAFSLQNARESFWIKCLAWLVLLYAPFATRSLGGLYATLLYIAVASAFSVRGRTSAATMGLSLLSVAALGTILLADVMAGSGIIDSIAKTQEATLDRWESNTLTSRLDNWALLLASGLPPIIGNGYVLVLEGRWFSPHSDHFRFLYGYGILAYVCIFREVVKGDYRSRRFLFLIPVIVAFTVNSFIDEPRFLFTGAVLLALAKVARSTDAPVLGEARTLSRAVTA